MSDKRKNTCPEMKKNALAESLVSEGFQNFWGKRASFLQKLYIYTYYTLHTLFKNTCPDALKVVKVLKYQQKLMGQV